MPSTVSDTGATIGLVALARKQGERDVYSGKRTWVRFALGMQIDVTLDPTLPDSSWQVIMHNVSGGGIGFWSRREIPAGTLVHISDHSADQRLVWLPAHVIHCTVGLRGYLIGASFDNPASPDDPADAAASIAAQEDSGESSVPRSPRHIRALLMKCASASALACIVAAASVLITIHYVPNEIGWAAQSALATLAAAIVGALWGWMTTRGEVLFLRNFQAEIRRLALGKSDEGQLPEAPSKELAGIRRAFLDLGARWRKHQDDERAQRQKLEELTQMKSNILSVVSHEMRTPLTSILLYAQMLTEELSALSRDDQQNFLKIIADECTRLSHLVDDLLEVQRMESGRTNWHMEAQDLAEVVRGVTRVFEAMAAHKQTTLTVSCPEKLTPVVADAGRMSQVLGNLISNAIKYTPGGGRVEVIAEDRGNEILIRVADNGPGIPRDKWDQIFDRFSQLSDPDVAENSGVGLGLYIVRTIVVVHGGAVWVDSQIGAGSCFCICLPTGESHDQAAFDPEDTTNVGRVLVCDADPELTARMAQALRRERFDVRVAHCGRRLLTQLDHGDVEVVVTDLSMPDMGAAELLGALNSLADRKFRTIIHSYEGDGRELTRRGVDIYLKRPVSKDEMVQAVELAMKKRSAAGLTVLVVENAAINAARVNELLTEAGHTVVSAESMKEALTLARDYATDVIVISGESLGARWTELKGFGIGNGDTTRVMVLCDSVRKNERRLQDTHHGVSVVAYRKGKEEVVVDAIVASQHEIEAEISR